MDLDTALIGELRKKYGVHTVILYGSRARGDATAESDIDVAGFADVAGTERDARMWNGLFLDAFVYPTEKAVIPSDAASRSDAARFADPEMMKLCGGRVLLDERNLGSALLVHLAAIERRGPPPVAASELQVKRMWARKMIARARRGDVEAHYRRHWLLYQLLEDYFALRGQWYRGPKRAFAELQVAAPATFSAFERALAPAATLEDIEALAEHVIA